MFYSPEYIRSVEVTFSSFNAIQISFASIVKFTAELNLYPHKLPTFHNLEKEAFWKHCGKRRKCWLPAFSPFSTMFSTLPYINFNFSFTFVLSSANAPNLDMSIILLFSKALNPSHTFPGFSDPQEVCFLKTLWKKEIVKMLVNSIFSNFHNVFYSLKDRKRHFSYIYLTVCKSFQFSWDHNFVIWY